MDKLHFINPEYLWGLLFLLIPLIVHLFNFRKAKIVFFTRVDLLKEVKTKKRNFSTLKKRLILITRLLVILFFVLATSSPYLSEVSINNKSSKATFLYLDNSFSMQAKHGDLTLLELSKKRIKEDYNNFSGISEVYLLSNNGYVIINSENQLMLELSKIEFSYDIFSSLKVKSKVFNLAQRELITKFNTIVFSDFNEDLVKEDSLFDDVVITKKPIYTDEVSNVSVDSLWLKIINISENKFTIGYRLSNYRSKKVEFNEIFKFDEKTQQSLTRSIKSKSDTVLEIQLSIPNSKTAKGVISINDGSIWYDNDLFFSVDFSDKSKVLFVGDKSNVRLSSILNDDFVQLENSSYSGFKTRELYDFDFLIYTVGNNYSASEVKSIKNYLTKDKELLIVPSGSITLAKFNKFLRELNIGKVYKYNSKEIAVTQINYRNQFFDDIFNSEVDNFEYPVIKNNFLVNIPNSVNLLSLEDGSPFLLKSKNIYLFTSSIFDSENPFVNKDLALPILYKMSSSSLQRSLYETVGSNTEIRIDDIQNTSISLGERRVNLNKLSFNKFELPMIFKSGNYDLYSDGRPIKTVSFNYRRAESNYGKNVEEPIGEEDKYAELKNQSNVIYLWKWCVTFALIFLIIEMLLISFMKEKSIKKSE